LPTVNPTVLIATIGCIGGAMAYKKAYANAKVSARQPCWSKTDFDVKLALKVILGHSFCNQLQADKG